MRLTSKILSISVRGVNNHIINGCRTCSRLSYIHQVGKEPLRALTIGKAFENVAKLYPDRECIVSPSQNKRLTYQEVLEESNKLAAGLRRLGLQKGDRIAIWAPNITEWLVTMLAAARAGLILVSLNPANQPKDMEYAINKVGIKVIVCPDQIQKLHFFDILQSICPELRTSNSDKLKCSNLPSLQTVITISKDKLRGTLNYNDVLEWATNDEIHLIGQNQNSIQPDDICNIQFTSGTTGVPKAATLSHFQTVNNSYHVGKRNELDKKHHTTCILVPYFHAYGLTVAILGGINFASTLVSSSPIYNPWDNLTTIKNERCSVVYGTPTMYVDLLNVQKEANYDFNLDVAVTGGSPCSPQLFKSMQNILNVKRVKSVYGQTEATAIIFQSLPIEEDEYKVTSTVGHVADHVEAKVVDVDGKIVPIGVPGELHVRGYCSTIGYWNDEEKTKEILDKNGWLKTGDQFILEANGYGRIVGRIKEMIIRGGENIYPKEIEDFLQTHPDILEAYVIGISHERLGEEVCVCVRLQKGADLSHKTLVDFCTGKLAYFKIPRHLYIMDNFPKTQSGKIQKNVLRNQIHKLQQVV